MKCNEWARLAGLVCGTVLAMGTIAGAQQSGTQDTGVPQGATASPTGAPGNTEPGGNGGAGDRASGADKKFAKEAMEGGLAEVQLGQMAAKQGSSDEVKQFGQKMVDDHTKMNEQMKPIAAQLGLTPPTDLDMKHKALQKKLNGLSGDAFDKAYIGAMVKDHQKDAAEFQKEATNGKNPQLKDAASQGEKVISEHLQMIQKMAQDHGSKTGQTAATTNSR